MLSQYGVQSKINVAAGAVNSPVNSNSYDIALSPLFFVRGGYINPNVTYKFGYAGRYGDYWSSRAYSAASFAYNLRFGSSDVYPSDDYNFNRHVGRSLRCLISTP